MRRFAVSTPLGLLVVSALWLADSFPVEHSTQLPNQDRSERNVISDVQPNEERTTLSVPHNDKVLLELKVLEIGPPPHSNYAVKQDPFPGIPTKLTRADGMMFVYFAEQFSGTVLSIQHLAPSPLRPELRTSYHELSITILDDTGHIRIIAPFLARTKHQDKLDRYLEVGEHCTFPDHLGELSGYCLF